VSSSPSPPPFSVGKWASFSPFLSAIELTLAFRSFRSPFFRGMPPHLPRGPQGVTSSSLFSDHQVALFRQPDLLPDVIFFLPPSPRRQKGLCLQVIYIKLTSSFFSFPSTPRNKEWAAPSFFLEGKKGTSPPLLIIISGVVERDFFLPSPRLGTQGNLCPFPFPSFPSGPPFPVMAYN